MVNIGIVGLPSSDVWNFMFEGMLVTGQCCWPRHVFYWCLRSAGKTQQVIDLAKKHGTLVFEARAGWGQPVSAAGMLVGLALNPATPLERLDGIARIRMRAGYDTHTYIYIYMYIYIYIYIYTCDIYIYI